MADVFLTSDLHLNHIKCATEWRGFSTVDEHNEFIIDSFNATVKNKNAKVYILGDIVFQPSISIPLIDKLYGNKILIQGNHDYSANNYTSYFAKISSSFSLKDAILTHIPVHKTQLDFRWKYNIHGHMHKPNLDLDDNRYFNVNVEKHNYKPITLDYIMDILRSRKCLTSILSEEMSDQESQLSLDL